MLPPPLRQTPDRFREALPRGKQGPRRAKKDLQSPLPQTDFHAPLLSNLEGTRRRLRGLRAIHFYCIAAHNLIVLDSLLKIHARVLITAQSLFCHSRLDYTRSNPQARAHASRVLLFQIPTRASARDSPSCAARRD